jgi:Capsule assembly protein Wzi
MKCVMLAILATATTVRADELWLQPITQASLHLAAYDEADRPYSVAARPRDVAGVLAISCEHTGGEPCGNGVGGYGELDSAGGYGEWLSFQSRLRARTGTSNYGNDVDIDHLNVDLHPGSFRFEVGRDLLQLGPKSHTQVGWGDNAPPLDLVRASYENKRGGLMYIVGRLRDPQTFSGSLVTIARGELVLGPVRLGAMQLLELEGDGAPHLGPWAFIEEHFTRGDASAGPGDSSNRRVGVDIDWQSSFARFYYELMFEDWRRQFADALRYDADHVLGLERAGLVIEWQSTGFRSMEHTPRVTGFTNAGRVVGSPLGPDAEALYVAQQLRVSKPEAEMTITVAPWVEVVRLSSATYSYGLDQPIDRVTAGQAEMRYRVGAHVVTRETHAGVEIGALYEHIEDFAFVTGARRNSIGADVKVTYYP